MFLYVKHCSTTLFSTPLYGPTILLSWDCIALRFCCLPQRCAHLRISLHPTLHPYDCWMPPHQVLGCLGALPPTPSALPGTPPFVFRMQLSSAEPQMVSNTGYTRLEGLLVCGLHLVLANCDVIGRQDQIVNRNAWKRSTVGQHGLSKCNMWSDIIYVHMLNLNNLRRLL